MGSLKKEWGFMRFSAEKDSLRNAFVTGDTLDRNVGDGCIVILSIVWVLPPPQ